MGHDLARLPVVAVAGALMLALNVRMINHYD